MNVINDVFLLCGGITVFLLGLRFIADGAYSLSGNKIESLLERNKNNSIFALLTGAFSTAVVQSSICTNMIAIAFVKKGIMTFYCACAVVMGTNIGTTITAQLVSFSAFKKLNIIAFFCGLSVVGFILSEFKGKKKEMGNFLMGFGLVFIGIGLITNCIEQFKRYQWFINLFLIKNPVALLLNGILITSIFQSSSLVTSVMVILSKSNLMNFSSSAFMILGANIGSCVPVILASSKMGKTSLKVAIFNLCFNLLGSFVFFLPLYLMTEKGFFSGIYNCILKGDISRSIANFHSFFNIIMCVIVLPFLKKFTALTEFLCDKLLFESKNSKLKTKVKFKNKAIKIK